MLLFLKYLEFNINMAEKKKKQKSKVTEEKSEETKESFLRDLRKQEKQIKIAFLFMVLLIASIVFVYWLSFELKKFNYLGLEFKKVSYGKMDFYDAKFPLKDFKFLFQLRQWSPVLFQLILFRDILKVWCLQKKICQFHFSLQ